MSDPITSEGLIKTGLDLWKSQSLGIINTALQEELFIRGYAFSFEDYFLMGASEVLDIVVDPTSFKSITGQNNLVFNNLGGSATAGPITIDIHAGVNADNDGDILESSNRRASIGTAAQVILRKNPTINNAGVKFAGDLIPGTGLNPATATGAKNTGALPFEITNTTKYMLRITNHNGADTYLQLKLTWFEV